MTSDWPYWIRCIVGLAMLGGAATVSALQNANVVWLPNPETNITNYKVYYRDSGSTQNSVVTVGNITTASVTGLVEGRTYLFSVTAVNSASLESDPSDPVSYFVNNPPIMTAIANRTAEVGLQLTVSASASDADAGQTLTFTLLPGAPAGASVNPATGLFTWTPGPEYAATTSSVGIMATDSGVPPRSGSTTFNITVQAPDADSDGIPDWYERLIGLNPLDAADGTSDLDGDGLTNLEEFVAGTDADDPASSLRILSVENSGNDVAIQFTSVLQRRYRIERTDQADQNSTWLAVQENVVGNGPIMTVTDPGGNLRPGRFYRVIVTPQ